MCGIRVASDSANYDGPHPLRANHLARLPESDVQGTAKIALNATISTREVVFNAKGLTLDRATIDGVAAQSVNMGVKLGGRPRDLILRRGTPPSGLPPI
jgi:hypothetical protein